ncbi:DNA recombination protein RecN [Actinotalea ferrariae]|uniref:hypothetical protein n=1 Tax=Actinotalea ferrariae TaxID=1386098 RepID=UPI001C8CCEF5|nr:hypothetical protein [Actinotalea ferrariae]MBX9244315.1 DNA recombination protein RecN [Actinotalea ferrariae]
MTDAKTGPTGLRLRELRLVGVAGKGPYGVRFVDDHGDVRPLSVIAGPSHTGKTSTAEFVQYLLGGKEHPQHPEIVGAVRSAMLELELRGEINTIERSAVGSPSPFASVWRGPLNELSHAREQRVSTDPPSDPEGLSQLVLGAFDLDGVRLPEAPTKEESRFQLLSIRDVFRVMFLPNQRLDNMDLAFERSAPMVRQKFRQLVDVMFGVHDPQAAELQANIREASEAVTAARRAEAALEQVAREDYPMGILELERTLEEAAATVVAVGTAIESLDSMQLTTSGAISEVRIALGRAQRAASRAAVRLRDRDSLLSRLTALRAQYADDKKKLTFLREAERLFNPLDVTTCPACFSALTEPPAVADGVCSLCRSTVPPAESEEAHLTPSSPGRDLIESELRAASRRLNDLNDYWSRLDDDRARLRQELRTAEAEVERLASEVDRVVETPAPWLAERDGLTSLRAEARLRMQFADSGLRVWQRVADATERRERLETALDRLRKQRSAAKNRPDREAVIRALSDRFASILEDFEYPKLRDASIGSDLIPVVRAMPYSSASSGGLVLISLAYHLAIWELAFERGAAAPGLLVIDSPQKNLGHGVTETDPDFADTRLVENFYRHVLGWLGRDGLGAQLVVIDNSPPNLVENHVVAHYTRNPEVAPYGLITDAVD